MLTVADTGHVWGEQSWEEMQYTEVSLTWKDETSANLKPEYMTEFTETRALGSLDSNLDGKLAKSEMRGRLGKAVLPEFDKLDLDKYGQLTEDEARALIPMLTKALSSSDQDL